eukprot:6212316-Pleurochrysis_carterae.AAC.3
MSPPALTATSHAAHNSAPEASVKEGRCMREEQRKRNAAGMRKSEIGVKRIAAFSAALMLVWPPTRKFAVREQKGFDGSIARRFLKVAAAPRRELAILVKSHAAELKSAPPIESSPKGLIRSSRAAFTSLPAVKTLNMRSGRWMPKARFVVLHPVGTSTSTGRVQVPSSRCTLESAVLARSMARVERKFSRRTVSAAVGVKC